MTEFRTPSRIEPVPRLPARQRISALALRGLAALGLLVLAVTFSPLTYWWASWLAGPWNDPSGEVLIVLAGDSIEGDFLGRSSYWRAVYAVLAWRQGVAGRVLISGGTPGAPLAGQMRNFLVHSGVPAERIEMDPNSQSTRESALQCAARLRGIAGTKVLLTSDYHMHRAVRCFRAAGLDVAPRPIPDARKQYMRIEERWSVFLSLVKETAKIVYYRLRGWM
ncbi:MAG: YdcF family protein [Bryobacterales bacterium]|nr:YdcF family protein [Bryobacterales bacterium]